MADPTVEIRDYCRACAAADPVDLPPLIPVLALGPFALSSFPAHVGEPQAHLPVPLTLATCPRCTLVQLRHTTPFTWLFGGQYWYRSGVNETMRAELADVARYAVEASRIFRHERGVVVDIGANDGTLLAAYPSHRFTRIAFEPSSLYQHLKGHCDELYAEAFPIDPRRLDYLAGQVSIVTACAMIYDLDDPVGFFQAIERLLAPDGVCVVQFQDLGQMVETTAFDCICHEHLEYYTLYALATLLNHVGLWAVDVERRAINGGSLRVTIKRKGAPAPAGGVERVLAQIQHEATQGLGTPAAIDRTLARMGRRMQAMRRQILATLAAVTEAGGVVDLYGASTKGNTLLQFLGVTRRTVRQAWERSEEKWGRVVGTSGIPIVAEAEGRRDPPELLLVPIWQFRDAVIAREVAYLAGGGTLLFPLPEAEIVRMAEAPAVAQAGVA